MIESLVNLDKKLLLALNHFASPGVDPLMTFLSGPVPWIVFISGFIYLVWRMYWKIDRKLFLIMIVSMIVAYTLTEFTSVHLFKEVFMRLRPCHEPSLAGQVRLVDGHCGGQYGFVSSHAANSFGLAILSALLVKRRWLTITVIAWAAVISYSRIYLGVHFPGDVIGGMLLGSVIALVVYLLTGWIRTNRQTGRQDFETMRG